MCDTVETLVPFRWNTSELETLAQISSMASVLQIYPYEATVNAKEVIEELEAMKEKIDELLKGIGE